MTRWMYLILIDMSSYDPDDFQGPLLAIQSLRNTILHQ